VRSVIVGEAEHLREVGHASDATPLDAKGQELLGGHSGTLAQPNAASFARRLALPCRAGTTPGRTDTGTGPLASLLTSRSTSGLPVMLTGHWSSLQLATGASRSRLLRQRAGV